MEIRLVTLLVPRDNWNVSINGKLVKNYLEIHSNINNTITFIGFKIGSEYDVH